jgi:hypothetical protein
LTGGNIDEDTNFPAWDGVPVDYDATVSALWECRQGELSLDSSLGG